MRISSDQIRPSEYANLSRTTRWRMAKRGWACPAYHQGTQKAEQRERGAKAKAERSMRSGPDEAVFVALLPNLRRQIRAAMRERRDTLPRYMDYSDAEQECLILLWQLSGSPAFASDKWRCAAINNRLHTLARSAQALKNLAMSLEDL